MPVQKNKGCPFKVGDIITPDPDSGVKTSNGFTLSHIRKLKVVNTWDKYEYSGRPAVAGLLLELSPGRSRISNKNSWKSGVSKNDRMTVFCDGFKILKDYSIIDEVEIFYIPK